MEQHYHKISFKSKGYELPKDKAFADAINILKNELHEAGVLHLVWWKSIL